MAIGYGGAGTVGNGTTSAAPSIPSGATSDDLLVGFVCNKPYSSTPTSSAGPVSTQQASFESGATANGNGVGSQRATIFTGTDNGNASNTYSTTSGSPTLAQILYFTKGAGETWSVDPGYQRDTSQPGTSVATLATSDQPTTLRPGDWLTFMVTGSDDAISHSSQSLAAVNDDNITQEITLGTITWLTKASTTSGNDAMMYIGYCEVIDTVTGLEQNARVSYLATSSVTDKSDTSFVFLRIRAEGAPPSSNPMPLGMAI